MQIETVICDIDGTLCDSNPDIHASISFICEQSGVTQPSFKDFCCQFDQPHLPYYRNLGIMSSEEMIWELYLNHKEQVGHRMKFFDGVPGALQKITENGIRLGFISGNTEKNIRGPFEYENLWDLFDPRARITETFHKTDAIVSSCEALCTAKKNVMYVGDLPSDMRHAKEAGVVAVGIVGEFPEREKILREAGADHCIKDFHDLLFLLGKIELAATCP